jgi:hypothetical protein
MKTYRAAPRRAAAPGKHRVSRRAILGRCDEQSWADVARIFDLPPMVTAPRAVGLVEALRHNPLRPSAQACRNMRSPSAASMCSEKISTGPALRIGFFSIARRPTSSTGRRSAVRRCRRSRSRIRGRDGVELPALACARAASRARHRRRDAGRHLAGAPHLHFYPAGGRTAVARLPAHRGERPPL